MSSARASCTSCTTSDDTYEYVVRALWITAPAVGARQAVALVVIWAHGCLGLYFWLRYRNWYAQAAPWLLIVAVLLPVLALLGFAHAGQTVAAMGPPTANAIDPALFDEAIAIKERIDRAIYFGFVAIVAAVLAARLVRDRIERRNLIEVDYPGGQMVRVPKGYSVLDASRLGGIPHYSVCGGRGRCSTCRVKVIEGLDGQPDGRPDRDGDACSAFPPKTTCGSPASSSRSTTSAVMPLLVPRSEQDAARRRPLGAPWPRAGGRGAVLRHAQLHRDRRPAPAVRHRVPAQPLFRDRRRGGREGRRPARQVHRRRRDGAVRPAKPRRARRAARRLPRRAPSSQARRG